MNTKKSLLALMVIDILFIGTYAVYLFSPIYLGYYPIGITQILLLVVCLTFFILYGKNMLNDTKKSPVANYILFILLIIGYLVSMGALAFSIFWWAVFMPL